MFGWSFDEITKQFKEHIKSLSLLCSCQLVIIWIIFFFFPSFGIQLNAFSPIKAKSNFWSETGPLFYHGLMHASVFHLITNSISLFFFGGVVERKIGTTNAIVLFGISIVFQPILILSFYCLKLSMGNPVVGISGYIFTLMIVNYYEHHKYMDIVYCCIINVLIYVMCLILSVHVSLAGHFSGILIGFLYTRGFLDWIFDSKLIPHLDSFLKKWFGWLVFYMPLQDHPINSESHLTLLSHMKSDLKLLATQCTRRTSNPNEINSLPV